MKHKLFYEGRLMGEISSPVEASVNFICWHCGRIFAKRICERPWTWKVDEGVCGKCGHERNVHASSLVFFACGAELTDYIDRPLLDFVQFVYEADIAIGPSHEYTDYTFVGGNICSADGQPICSIGLPLLGFAGPEHSWSKDPPDGGLGNR